MTRDLLRFLLSPRGEAAMEEAGLGNDPLATIQRLRRRWSTEEAAAALQMAELRKRGAAKFSRSDRMLFTRPALEMATSECVARWRARRFAGYERVGDLTCGIGGDALALAENSLVFAMDRDPLLLQMARHNARIYESEESFLSVCADVTTWHPPFSAIFVDPARRSEGRRLRRDEELHPPLPEVLNWARRSEAAGIKLSPAFDWEPYLNEAEVEIVSEKGECREAVLWFGAAKTGRIRASIVDKEVSLMGQDTEPAPVHPAGKYLYEPDPAVRRAHLVDQLAEETGAWKLDPEIAYLSSDEWIISPFWTAYRVEEAFPFRLKELQRRLRIRGVGKVIVKKRGVAYDPAEIEKRLKLEGEDVLIVMLTRIGSTPMAYLAQLAE